MKSDGSLSEAGDVLMPIKQEGRTTTYTQRRSLVPPRETSCFSTKMQLPLFLEPDSVALRSLLSERTSASAVRNTPVHVNFCIPKFGALEDSIFPGRAL